MGCYSIDCLDRKSDNRLTIRDFDQVPHPIEHRSDTGMVLLFCMVVQRGIHVVGAHLGRPRLDI